MTPAGLPDKLHLCGYVRLADRGFALPAYQVKPGANAWYAAVALVNGDHASEIEGFELLEDVPVELLDTGIIVGRHDLWRDVFLWEGEKYAGRPSEILEALGELRDELLTHAPLSYLDLALPAEAPDTADITEAARDFLEQKLGVARGAANFIELVLRPAILIELRRGANSRLMSVDELDSLRNFRVRQSGPARYDLEIAAKMSEMFDRAAFEELEAAVSRFAGRLGITLKVIALKDYAGDHIEAERLATPPNIRRSRRSSRRESPNILIIAADRRSQAICRHLEPPSSVASGSGSVWEGEYRIDHRDGLNDLPEPHGGVILIVDNVGTRDAKRALSVFDVIVWLAGNDALLDARSNDIYELARHRDPQTPFLIAPAPPADGPTVLMEPRSRAKDVLGQANAVIDTTLARSPFWTGQLRRSIDRRMADMIATVSILAAAIGSVRHDLNTRRGSKQPSSATLSIGERRFGHEAASELNATSLRGMQSDRRISSRHGFEIREQGSTIVRNAALEINPLWTDFERFGEAAFFNAMGREADWPNRSLITGVPDNLLHSLDAPDLSVALNDIDGKPSLVLTAESPRLATIREAWDSGLAVARYTDTATIRATALQRNPFRLPEEMRFPKLARLAQNQGLVTRGVDARDVLRLAETDWLDIRNASVSSSLPAQARKYRPTVGEAGSNLEIALPTAAIWDGMRNGDSVARELLGRFPKLQERGEKAGKRMSDLIAAWTRPSDGMQRWIIEDGRIPVEAGMLRAEEVPAQRLFFIDGDQAVPCIILSRPFAVWAKALLPASTSWASRFQVSRTFDAFPFPLCFRIERSSDEEPPQLRFARGHERLKVLGERLSRRFMGNGRNIGAEFSDEMNYGRDEMLEELDRILLREMNLPDDASDLDILEALVERNRDRL